MAKPDVKMRSGRDAVRDASNDDGPTGAPADAGVPWFVILASRGKNAHSVDGC